MPNYLLHLWAPPPADLPLTCPPPPPGMIVSAPQGFYDPASVEAAYAWAGYLSLFVVIALVLFTYLAASGSLSPRFVKRWWIVLATAAASCLAISALALYLYPTHALAGSCQSDPTAFTATLPMDRIWIRAFAGLVWGALVFAILSVLLTRGLGRWPWSRGVFHFRGCPVPRFRP